MSRDDWAPAIPGGRCAMPRRDAELQDTWLTPNGVDGYLTEHAVITIHNGEISYAAWLHTDGSCTSRNTDLLVLADLDATVSGRSPSLAAQPLTVRRTIPVRVPVTDRVRVLFATSTLTLIEA